MNAPMNAPTAGAEPRDELDLETDRHMQKLAEALTGTDQERRRLALAHTRALPDSLLNRVVNLLSDAMEVQCESIQNNALQALMAIGKPAVSELLRRTSKTQTASCAYLAIVALGAIGHELDAQERRRLLRKFDGIRRSRKHPGLATSSNLVSGSSEGGVYWARNKAGKGKVPDLEPFRTLIEPGPPVKPGQPLRESDLTGPTRATRVWVADVNGDGKLDLLVGDCVTLVSPADGISDAELKKKYADWEKEFQAALASLNAASDDTSRKKATEKYHKVYGQRSAFMHEEMTGFVWLYLQK